MHSAASKWFLVIAALLGFAGVALAALGSHAFAAMLADHQSGLRFDSALRMHLLHAPALLALAAAQAQCAVRWWLSACLLLTAGTLVFCGGLYLAALGVSSAWIPIVPAGGSALMLGWLAAAVGFIRQK